MNPPSGLVPSELGVEGEGAEAKLAQHHYSKPPKERGAPVVNYYLLACPLNLTLNLKGTRAEQRVGGVQPGPLRVLYLFFTGWEHSPKWDRSPLC